MISSTGVFLVALLGCFSAVLCEMKCPGVAEYELSFYGMWSDANHPNGAFPSGGKFSPWVGCSHNNDYTMWDMNMLASTGVKNVAEMGDAMELQKEITEQMTAKTAWKLILQSGGATDGSAKVSGIKVEVTADYPLVSLVSMLNPSPDWFTGIKKRNLCNSGKWRDSWNITVHPWDAGTDDGQMFTGNQPDNQPTTPPENITMITSASGTPFKEDPIKPLGMLMFKRVNKPAMHSCSGEQKYTLEFTGMWSKERQPSGFPNGAHFSALIGCTHKYNYKFWSPMTMASPGVKDVAENGDTTKLKTDLKTVMGKGGYIYNVYVNTTTDGTGTTKMEIMVKDMYSMVSIISMLGPSPDWFVGLDSADLCGANGWKETYMKELHAYDAGTEEGMAFSMDNQPTMPQDVITLITKDSNTVLQGNADILPFAKITLTKYKAATAATEATTKPTDSAHTQTAGVSVVLSMAFLAILRFLY